MTGTCEDDLKAMVIHLPSQKLHYLTVIAVGSGMNETNDGADAEFVTELSCIPVSWIGWGHGTRVVRSHEMRKSRRFNEPAGHVGVHLRDAPPLVSKVKIEAQHSCDARRGLIQSSKLLFQCFRKPEFSLQIGAAQQLAFSKGQFATQSFRNRAQLLPFTLHN